MQVDRINHKSKRTHGWTPAQRRQYEEYWPSGSRERLAYALGFYTAQGSADVSYMGQQMEHEGAIQGRRIKTGVSYRAPIPPVLEAELQHWRDEMVYLRTEYGKSFSERGLHNWFSSKITEAGLPDECTPHGLRVAGCEELAESGCTANEINGHCGL